MKNKVACACGCKNLLTQTDERGRARRFIHGHNGRTRGRMPTAKKTALARERALRWYRANRERVAKRNATCVENRRAYNQKYARLHPDKMRAKTNRRRCLLAGANGFHTTTKWYSRVAFWGWHCFYCGKELCDSTLTQDHRIPISRGGTDFPSNLVPACKSCNSKKKDRSPHEFQRSNPRG